MIRISIFGSELRVKDGFSNTYNSFASQTKNAKNDMDRLKASIKDTEKTTEISTGNMRSQVMSLASQYKKAGLSQSDAMKKAWNEIERTSKKSSDNVKKGWKNAFGDITKSGKSAFDGLNSGISSLAGTLAKFTAGYLSVKGAIGLVKGSINDASAFQNASTFLQATYGEQQGKEKYKWATQEANKTPFSEMEVANGLARAHALNLKDDAQTFKMYEDLGSFAKIQGVGDLNSSIDAISDAQGGQWERLQTITGTKREALEQYAKEKNLGKFTNKKGQVTDKETLMKVLQSYMDDKGISGMTDKFSKTFSGRISTLKGNVEKTLAEIGGIQADGSVKDGSLFDNASKGLEKLIDSVNKFGKSQSFEIIADGLGKLGNGIVKGLNYVTEHPEVATGIVKVGGAILGLKVATTVLSPVLSLTSTISSLAGTSIVGASSLTGLVKGLGIASVGFVALASLLSEDGILHRGINSAMNSLAGNKPGEQQDYIAESIAGFGKMGSKAIEGIGSFIGSDSLKSFGKDGSDYWDYYVDKANNKLNGHEILDDSQRDRWYGANNVSWSTVPNMINSGAVTKTTNNASSTINNKADINVNVGTVRETADIDEIANQLASKINKVFNTRNAVIY